LFGVRHGDHLPHIKLVLKAYSLMDHDHFFLTYLAHLYAHYWTSSTEEAQLLVEPEYERVFERFLWGVVCHRAPFVGDSTITVETYNVTYRLFGAGTASSRYLCGSAVSRTSTSTIPDFQLAILETPLYNYKPQGRDFALVLFALARHLEGYTKDYFSWMLMRWCDFHHHDTVGEVKSCEQKRDMMNQVALNWKRAWDRRWDYENGKPKSRTRLYKNKTKSHLNFQGVQITASQ
jgi:hypothetical protein